MFRSKTLSHPFFVSTLLLGGLALVACDSDDSPADPTGPGTTAGTGGDASTGSGDATTSSSSGGDSTSSSGGMGQGGMGQGGMAEGGMGQGGAGGAGGQPLEPATCVGPMTGTDTCPGEGITLNSGDTITLCGDLTTATDDHTDPFCGPAQTDSPDNIYSISTTAAGTLKVRLKRDGGLLNPTMYIRYPESLFPGACSDDTGASSGGCWDFFDAHEDFGFDWDPAFLDSFHLIVDGGRDQDGNQTTGRYELELSLQPAACGDAVQNWTEECDDGNTVDGDGCSSACVVEPNPIHDTCPGEPIFDTGSMTAYADSTFGRTDAGTPAIGGSCSGPAAGGPDRVYRFTATHTGLVRARVGVGPDCETDICDAEGTMSPHCFDSVLWVTQDSCGDTNEQVACSDSKVYGAEEVVFWGEVAKDYYIFVDGYNPWDMGYYNLCVRQY